MWSTWTAFSPAHPPGKLYSCHGCHSLTHALNHTQPLALPLSLSLAQIFLFREDLICILTAPTCMYDATAAPSHGCTSSGCSAPLLSLRPRQRHSASASGSDGDRSLCKPCSTATVVGAWQLVGQATGRRHDGVLARCGQTDSVSSIATYSGETVVTCETGSGRKCARCTTVAVSRKFSPASIGRRPLRSCKRCCRPASCCSTACACASA